MTTIIAEGYIPVIAPLPWARRVSYNINADTAAGRLAAALGADKLIILTDVEGEGPERPGFADLGVAGV